MNKMINLEDTNPFRMKQLKSILLLLMVVTLISCSDDDVEIATEIFDPQLKEYIIENNIDHVLDPYGSPVRPNQLIVTPKPGQNLNDLRLKYEVTNTKSCFCLNENAELWTMDATFVDGNGGLEGTREMLSGESEPEEVEFNQIVPLQLFNLVGFTATPDPDPETEVDNAGPVVVHIDSGFDWDFDFSQTTLLDRLKYPTDVDCWIDMPNNYGINMVDGNNYAHDQIGHGTHTAGIIAQRSGDKVATPVPYGIVPVKAFGGKVGDIFDIYCSFQYANQINADIVNASFGWYKSESQLIKQVITELNSKNIVVVTSAGNIASDNDKVAHYPSNYSRNMANVISVTGLNVAVDDLIPMVSNIGGNEVKIAAAGENIASIVPSNLGSGDVVDGTGTSMAAAAVTGLLLKIMDECPTVTTAAQAKDVLLNASNINHLEKLEGKTRTEGLFDESAIICN